MASFAGSAEDSYLCESGKRKHGRCCPFVLPEGSILIDLEAIHRRWFKSGCAENRPECHDNAKGVAQTLARGRHLAYANLLASAACVTFEGLRGSSCRNSSASNLGYYVIEGLLFGYFFAELSIRLLAGATKRYRFFDCWVLFEGGLVFLMLLDICFTFAIWVATDQDVENSQIGLFERAICILRLAQLGRVVRLLAAVPDILLFVRALRNSSRCFFACLGLSVMSIYVFAVACLMIMEGTRAGDTYFATLGQAISTILLRGVFMDGVSDVVQELHITGSVYSFVFVGFSFFMHYCLLATLIGMTSDMCSKFMKSEQHNISFNFAKKQMLMAIEDLGFQADSITKSRFMAMLESPTSAAVFEKLGADVSGLLCSVEAVFADRKEISLSSLADVVLSSRCSASSSSWDFRQRALLTVAALGGRAQQDEVAEAIERLERRFQTRLSMQEAHAQNPDSSQEPILREEAIHCAPAPTDADGMKSDGSLASWTAADKGESEREGTSIVEQSLDTLFAELHKTLHKSREKIMRAHLQALSQMKTVDTKVPITPKLEEGMRVRVIGLVSRPQLNGMEGILSKFVGTDDDGWWKVQFEDMHGKKLRPENLEPVAVERKANDAEAMTVTEPARNGQLMSPGKHQEKPTATSSLEVSQSHRHHTRSSILKAKGAIDYSAMKDRSLSPGQRSLKDRSASPGGDSQKTRDSSPRRSASPQSPNLNRTFYRGYKMTGLPSEGSMKANDRVAHYKNNEIKDPMKSWVMWPRFRRLIVSRFKEATVAMNGSYSDALFRRVDRKNDYKLQYAQVSTVFRSKAFHITEKEMSNAELRLFCQHLDPKKDGHVEIGELMKLPKLPLDDPEVSDVQNQSSEPYEAPTYEATAEKKVEAVFDKFDRNKDGVISPTEWRHAQDGREKLPSSSRGLKESLQKSHENDLGDPSLLSTQASRRSSRGRSEAEDLSSPVKHATPPAQNEEVQHKAAAITSQSVQRGRSAKREVKQKNPNGTQSSSGKHRLRSPSESSGSNKSSIRSTPTLEPSRELNAHTPSKKQKPDSPEWVEPSPTTILKSSDAVHAPNNEENRGSFGAAEPSEGPVFKSGDVVQIVGLKGNPQFNGAQASIVDWKESKARYRVRLSSGEVKLFKNTNLQLAS